MKAMLGKRTIRQWALCGMSLAALTVVACGDDDDTPGTEDGGKSDVTSDGRKDVVPTIDVRDSGTPDTRDGATVDSRDAAPEGGEAGDGGQSPVQRGEYLVKVIGACGDCHTPRLLTGAPDNSRFLGGMPGIFQIPGLGPDGGAGIIGSSNLTPDMATGLGGWTDAQIKKAFLDGVDKDGKALFPIMPYYVLHNMSAADADAVVAYLRSIPAVTNAIPARNFDLPGPSPSVPADKIPNPTLQPTDADYASAMRGKYLAGSIGVCMECHTEHVQTPGAVPLNLDKIFGGGDEFVAQGLGLPSPPFPQVFYSENITPHTTGIQGWTAAAVIKVMKEGVDKDGVAICPPMPNGPMGAFGGMTDTDARDIANYIVHLPPIDNTIALTCHDYMNRDGGAPDVQPPDVSVDSGPGTPDATIDVGPDGASTTDAPPDGSSVDVANDTAMTDTPTNDGASPDAPSEGGSDATSGDGSTGTDGSNDAAAADGAADGTNG